MTVSKPEGAGGAGDSVAILKPAPGTTPQWITQGNGPGSELTDLTETKAPTERFLWDTDLMPSEWVKVKERSAQVARVAPILPFKE